MRFNPRSRVDSLTGHFDGDAGCDGTVEAVVAAEGVEEAGAAETAAEAAADVGETAAAAAADGGGAG